MARFRPEMARRPAPLILLRREDYRRVELCNYLGEYVYVVTPKQNDEPKLQTGSHERIKRQPRPQLPDDPAPF
jgi:hypothetical protein